MMLLTYASYKERFKLYAEIHHSIAVIGCQIKLARKGIILLSKVALILYVAGSRKGRHLFYW